MECQIIEYMAKGQDNHWWFQGRASIIDTMITKTFGSQHLRILEIGSGTGACIPILTKHGDVTVIEPDPICRKYLTRKFNITAIPGRVPDDIPIFQHKFDLICLFDVLEHIDEDDLSLLALKDLLTPNGRIMITVPAYQWLWSPLDELSHHKRRYNAMQLKNVIKKAKLNSDQMTYFNTFLFPLAFIARRFDRTMNRNKTSGYEVPHSIINSFFKFIFSIEKYFLTIFNLPFGLSLLAIMKNTEELPSLQTNSNRLDEFEKRLG